MEIVERLSDSFLDLRSMLRVAEMASEDESGNIRLLQKINNYKDEKRTPYYPILPLSNMMDQCLLGILLYNERLKSQVYDPSLSNRDFLGLEQPHTLSIFIV